MSCAGASVQTGLESFRMGAAGTTLLWKTCPALLPAGRGLEKLTRFSLLKTKCRGDYASTDFFTPVNFK